MNKRTDKKEHLIWSGLAVLQRQGYNGTGVKDIVDAAGVPKGSFYNYFESKEGFAVEALDAAGHKAMKVNLSLLFEADKTPLERLHNFFEIGASRACDENFQVGCFFGNMCQEMADSSESIRNKLRSILENYTGILQDLLEQAKLAGEVDSAMDTQVTAEFLLNAWEGTLMRMKASKTREPLDAFLKMLPQIVH